jgi:nitroimidazol reductase NimA-like FMN-containing flavoprotein (pyridoxamine 5'-phosphate oxidase superfamily)
MTVTPLQPTVRTTLRRSKELAATDRQALYDVLLDGMFCHLGVIVDGAPLVLPTAYGVDLDRGPDGTLYLHGSVAARSVVAAPEQTICVTITHTDGLVLARSQFHHSVNYRSAVIFGVPRLVTDPDEKLHGLTRIVDHLVPGRSTATRPPSRKELAKTSVLALPLRRGERRARGHRPSILDGRRTPPPRRRRADQQLRLRPARPRPRPDAREPPWRPEPRRFDLRNIMCTERQ